jgi:hypothetical protein
MGKGVFTQARPISSRQNSGSLRASILTLLFPVECADITFPSLCKQLHSCAATRMNFFLGKSRNRNNLSLSARNFQLEQKMPEVSGLSAQTGGEFDEDFN